MTRSWLDEVEMSTVIVVTTNGESFKGLKRAVYDDCIVLRDVMLLEENSTAMINGDFVIPRDKVLGIQLINGDA